MNLVCKIPTRGRPEKFFATLVSFVTKQSEKNNVQYLISIDDDDETMPLESINNTLIDMRVDDICTVISAPRAGKIGSVNRDMEHAMEGWDIVLQPADDWICHGEDWDQRIVEEMELFEDLDGVVWFFDGYNREIDTLCIMGRKYYERFNYIYYPEYRTFWADTEFTEVADLLGKLVFVDEVLFEHQHPDWTHSHGYDGMKRGYDQLYIENDAQEDRDWDEELFHKRQARGFDLGDPEVTGV